MENQRERMNIATQKINENMKDFENIFDYAEKEIKEIGSEGKAFNKAFYETLKTAYLFCIQEIVINFVEDEDISIRDSESIEFIIDTDYDRLVSELVDSELFVSTTNTLLKEIKKGMRQAITVG